MTERGFCTKCGRTTDGSCRTMDGVVMCETCYIQSHAERDTL